MACKLERELITAFVKDRRSNYAARKQNSLPGSGVNFRGAAGTVDEIDQSSGKDQRDEAAGIGKRTGPAASGQGQDEQQRKRDKQFAAIELDEMRKQDTGGDRDERSYERIFHGS